MRVAAGAVLITAALVVPTATVSATSTPATPEGLGAAFDVPKATHYAGTATGSYVIKRVKDVPGEKLHFKDVQQYALHVSFSFTVSPSGQHVSGVGTGAYDTATWEILGTHRGAGIDCSLPLNTSGSVGMGVGGSREGSALKLTFKLSNAVEVLLSDVDCGGDFTAYAGQTNYMAESLELVGGTSLIFDENTAQRVLTKTDTSKVGGDWKVYTRTAKWTISVYEDPELTDDEKADYAEAGRQDTQFAAELAIVAAACGAAGAAPCTAAAGIGAAAFAALGAYYTNLSGDPPDRRYRTVVHLRRIRVRPVRAGPGVTAEAARGLNAYLVAEVGGLADGIAFLGSLERMQAAEIAGNQTWRARQLTAARTYAAKLLAQLQTVRRLGPTTARALRASGFPGRLSADELGRARTAIGDRGLPSTVVSALRAFPFPGLAEHTRDAVLLISARRAASLGGLPGVLGSRDLDRAVGVSIRGLRLFLARTR